MYLKSRDSFKIGDGVGYKWYQTKAKMWDGILPIYYVVLNQGQMVGSISVG